MILGFFVVFLAEIKDMFLKVCIRRILALYLQCPFLNGIKGSSDKLIASLWRTRGRKNNQIINRMTAGEIRRIPRPRGITNTARTQENGVAYDKMIQAYLQGAIPDAVTLSAYEFGLLYNIPDNLIQSRIKDGLVSGLLQDNNMIKTLEEERLKILSTSLHRLGSSDQHLNNLLAYLSRRILSSPRAPAEIVKELNTTIGTQVRLTETSFKAITILNQALSSVIQEAPSATEEKQIDREQILLEMEKMKIDGNLDHYLEGVPDLSPHNLGALKKRDSLNQASVHEFNPAKEVDPVLIPEVVTVPPQ